MSSKILEKFYEAIQDEQEPRTGIHVSSLCYSCLRRGYYSLVHGDYFDRKNLLTFWIGRMLHKTKVLAEQEIKLEWERIKGSCDDYENGWLIDKKTCTVIPERANLHHITQLEYYAVMLEAIGQPVNHGWIIYIDISNKRVAEQYASLRKGREKIKTEMREKRDILEKALATKTPPERNIDWLCDYCSFSSICFSKPLKDLNLRDFTQGGINVPSTK